MKPLWLKSLQLLMTSQKGLVKDGFLTLMDQSGYSAASMLTGVLLARSCGASQFGVFVLMLTYIFFAKTFARSLITVPFSVNYPKLNDDLKKTLLGNTLIQYLGLTALLAIGLWPTAWVLNKTNSSADSPTGYFVYVLATMLLADFVRTVLLCQFHYRRSFWMGIITQFATAATLVLLYFFACLDMRSACITIGVGYMLFILLSAAGFSRHLRWDGLLWKQNCRDNFRQGQWILSGTLLNYAGVQLLPWLTLFWHDSSVVATAGVLGTVASFIRPVMQSMIHFLVPRFSEAIKRQGMQAARDQAIFLTQSAIAVGIPLSAALYWMGDGLVELVYGKGYCGYPGTLMLFSVAAFIRAANAPMRSLITAAGQAQRLVSSGVGATMLCVLAAWMWIPRYGVTGYAIAYLVYNGTFFLTNSVQALCGEMLTESHSAAVVG